jgi:hypothetical protein
MWSRVSLLSGLVWTRRAQILARAQRRGRGMMGAKAPAGEAVRREGVFIVISRFFTRGCVAAVSAR